MIRLRLSAAVRAFRDPGLANDRSATNADRLDRLERTIPAVAQAVMANTLGLALKEVRRTGPREADDPWWDGYDSGLADARSALTKLRDELVIEVDEVPR